MGAEDKLSTLEYELFCQVRDQIASQVVRIQKYGQGHCRNRRVCLPVRRFPCGIIT